MTQSELAARTGLTRGPGQPQIGTAIKATIPDDQIAMIDQMIERGEAKTRSAAIRAFVSKALGAGSPESLLNRNRGWREAMTDDINQLIADYNSEMNEVVRRSEESHDPVGYVDRWARLATRQAIREAIRITKGQSRY